MQTKRADIRLDALWCWLLMALAFVVSLWWFVLPLLHAGDDAFYHMLRIEALYQQLSHGLWREPLNRLFFQGAGYASATCYPDIFLYIPALLRFGGLEIAQCFSLFIMLCMGASLLTAFWAGKSITGSSFIGAAVAIIYALCQYKMDCSYARAALGEIQAFVFLPLVAAALHDLAFRHFSRPWLMVLAFGGLMLTHTLSCFVAVLLSALFCLIFVRRVWAHVPRLCLMAGLTLALTAFYWLPCMELLLRMDLHAAHPWTFAFQNAVAPTEVFANVLLGEGKAGLGWELPLLCLPVLCMHGGALRRMAWFCLIGALLLTVAATSLVPWEKAGVLGVVQFPWRLYSFASLLYALAAACGWQDAVQRFASKGQAWAGLALAALTLVMVVAAVRHAPLMDNRYFDLGKDYFAQGAETTYVGGGEWLPFTLDLPQLKLDLRACARDARSAQCPRAVDDRQNPVPLLRSADGTRLTVGLNGATRRFVDVPLVWYYGYTAFFVPADKAFAGEAALAAAMQQAVQAAVPTGAQALRVTDNGKGFCRVWLEGAEQDSKSRAVSAENAGNAEKAASAKGTEGAASAASAENMAGAEITENSESTASAQATNQPEALGQAGLLLVQYAGTRVQFGAGWFSFATLVFVCLGLARRLLRRQPELKP
ncbi:MAG: hypothetical protein PHN64_02945 [Desulfovibrionaceae bacterium]|nr:hypothetical protein [Desulfovibrionaceae bacterium]